MKKIFSTILCLIGFVTFGQVSKVEQPDKALNSIGPNVLESLYVQALNHRLDLILSSGWHYIEMNEYGKRIKNLNVSNRYKFLSDNELIDLSITKKKTINVIRVVHNVVAQDTIDLNFGAVNVTAKRKIHFYHGLRFKKANYTISCGGTNGYKPDIRFVFDKKIKDWKILETRFLVLVGNPLN